MKNFQATCFYAKQNQHYEIETTKPIEEGEKKLKFNKIMKHDSTANKALQLKAPKAAAAQKSEPAKTPEAEVASASDGPDVTTTLQLEESQAQESKAKSQVKNKLHAKKKRSNLHLEHVPSDEMDLLISTINNADLGWKASTCKLQKHHADYGKGETCEDELVQLSDEEIGPIHPDNMLIQLGNEQLEGMKISEFGGKDDKLFAKTLEDAQKWKK